VGGNDNRNGGRKRWVKPWVDKAVAATVRTRSVRPGHLCSYRGTDGWAPRGFDFFQFIQNRLNFKILKLVPYLAPKISNFCMWIS
jgi:hypothetical protein